MIKPNPPNQRERDLMRHCLGLRDGAKVASRNHYCAGTAAEAEVWRGLVARGLAKAWPTKDSSTDPIFEVLEVGAKMVLDPGDTIDHEVSQKFGA